MADKYNVKDVVVAPTKDGRWRLYKIVSQFEWDDECRATRPYMRVRLLWWLKRVRAYQNWYDRRGYRLAVSPEMWMERSVSR